MTLRIVLQELERDETPFDAIDLTGLRELVLEMGRIEERLYELDEIAQKHKAQVLAKLSPI